MITDITPKELKARLDAGEDIDVIDVREDWELARSKLSNIIHIPMNDVPDRLDEITKDKPVVIMCHHGNRSEQVINWLETEDYENLLNLVGGIDRWSHEVDSSIPLY
ncbi:MAG: rhodanese-like domain-containing protein [Chloroflexota bacterium]